MNMLVSKRLAREAFARETSPDDRKGAAMEASALGGTLSEGEEQCIPADKPWLNERIFKVGLNRCSDDDCPICFEPLPFDGNHYMLRVCCMQRICNGCMMAAYYKGISTCPFCRSNTPTSPVAALALLQKRVEVGNFSANPSRSPKLSLTRATPFRPIIPWRSGVWDLYI